MSDATVTVVGSFAVGLSLRCERWPVPGETVMARDFDEGPGGKGSNQAVQAARLGCAVEFVGAIGADRFGDVATELFDAEGVGTSFLGRTPRRNTGVGFIVLDGHGDNRIVLDPGANASFAPADVGAARDALVAARVVLTQLEIPLDTAAAALRLAHSEGVLTMLNPAPATPVPAEVLADVDILTPNQAEARMLVGLPPDDPRDDEDVCRRLLDLGVATVVATRGSHGALVVSEQETFAVPAHAVDVVDSTGAGDAFNGTLAAALAGGAALDEGVRRAAAAGALACRRLGVIPSLPRLERLEAFLDDRRGP